MTGPKYPRLCQDPMRSRLQIILDHATLHKLTAEQIHELVSLLPDHTSTAQIIPLRPAVRRDKAAG